MEAENESNEEVFYHAIVPSSLQSATNCVDYTKQFIFPVIHHEANNFKDLDIEAITTSLSTELNWAIKLGASPHTTTARDTSLSV